MLIHRNKSRKYANNPLSLTMGLVVVLVLMLAGSIAAGVFLFSTTERLWKSPRGEMKIWMTRLGRDDSQKDAESVAAALLRVSAGYGKSLVTQSPDVPLLILDIKFKHILKLHAKRQAALDKGVLEQEEGDFVPASLRIGERTVKVKLRLKGDRLDHLQGNKWSMRVEVKGDDHVFGMRRFSLQHPVTRSFHNEMLFMETLAHSDVLGVRYQFVDVVINGDSIGLMAVEEHFSKELLEYRARREGIIMRFDERAFWEHQGVGANWRQSPYNSFRNTNIDAFRAKRISNSPAMAALYETIAGLVRSFGAGKIPASELFDADITARYLAALELWGSWHSIQWNDMRFYVDPLTLKIEPIGYDSNLTLQSPIGDTTLLREPIFEAMLADPEIRSRYFKYLRLLCQDVLDGELFEKLSAIQDSQLPLLRYEFYLVEPLNFSKLKKRARILLAMSDGELMQAPKDYPRRIRYPVQIHANLIKGDTGNYLELASALPESVTIESIIWAKDKAGLPRPVRMAGEGAFPLELPATALRQSPVFTRLTIEDDPEVGDSKILIRAKYANWPLLVEIEPTPYYSALLSTPIPDSTAAEQLKRHSFLSVNESDNTLIINGGSWQVTEDLIIPKGFKLLINAGVTLEFAADTALIAYGAVTMSGSAESPIILRGISGEQWQGIAVLKVDSKSSLKHLRVLDTVGVQRGSWQLTGGVTFYHSDVEIENVSIKNHQGEDALNLVRSQFKIQNLEIADTLSDAFDADFSNGEISNSLFTNIGLTKGGDAIDVSGTEITVREVRFKLISDKALSVGEASRMTASDIEMEDVGTALASKDGSHVDIQNLRVEGVAVAALMAYIKKPEYGTATIEARGVEVSTGHTLARVQTGSRIVVDGQSIPSEDLDVDLLYKTVMDKRSLR